MKSYDRKRKREESPYSWSSAAFNNGRRIRARCRTCQAVLSTGSLKFGRRFGLEFGAHLVVRSSEAPIGASVGQASCLSTNDRQDACPTKMAREVALSARSGDTGAGMCHRIGENFTKCTVSQIQSRISVALGLLRRYAPRNDTLVGCQCDPGLDPGEAISGAIIRDRI
jgi:hypothetical protein